MVHFYSERKGMDNNCRDRQDFNYLISDIVLVEIPLRDHRYTWSRSSMREEPSLAKLDRVMVSEDWKAKFRLAIAITLKRPISDHVPICVKWGETRERKSRISHSEKWWLGYEEVHQLVRQSWYE